MCSLISVLPSKTPTKQDERFSENYYDLEQKRTVLKRKSDILRREENKLSETFAV